MDEYDFCACQHVFLEDRENDINFWFQKNRENHVTKSASVGIRLFGELVKDVKLHGMVTR